MRDQDLNAKCARRCWGITSKSFQQLQSQELCVCVCVCVCVCKNHTCICMYNVYAIYNDLICHFCTNYNFKNYYLNTFPNVY